MRHWYSNVEEASSLDVAAGLKMKNSRIEIDQDNARIGNIAIGRNCTLINARVSAKLGSRIVIGDNAVIRGNIICERDSVLTIGNDFVCNAAVEIRSAEGASLTIGDGCLLANVSIYNTDYHGVYDFIGRKRINPARDVIIHDRVWLSQSAIILKGSEIGPDTVVAAGAVVTKKMPGSSVLAGNPARVIRRGIRWDRWGHDALPESTCDKASKDEIRAVNSWRRKRSPLRWFLELFSYNR